jgi:hypothetical protein
MNNSCTCTAILVPRSDDQALHPAVFVFVHVFVCCIRISLFASRETRTLQQQVAARAHQSPRRGVTLFTHARVPLLMDYGYHTHA